MVDFMCQLNWTTSARYLVKYTLGVSMRVFWMRFMCKSVGCE